MKIQMIAGIVSLVGLLTYTLVHTGGLLARYAPWGAGYLAALGIEIAIVSLSLRIGELRKRQQGTRFFWFVLVAVVVVSALANVSEGFHTSQGVPLTVSNAAQLDPVQALIGLAATGLISLIVLALSEIIGTDAEAIARANEKERRKSVQSTETNIQITTIEHARLMDLERDRANKEQRLAAILDIYRERPDAQPKDVYRPLGIARTTFYAYKQELVQQGRLVENGHGIEVIEQ